MPIGASLQAAVEAAPAGSSFLLAGGVHRGDDVAPKTGDSFYGAAGAILDGATVMTDWQAQGSRFMAGGLEAQGARQGNCAAATPLCAYPDDVFVDQKLQTRVDSLAAVMPGTYWIDYSRHQLWVGANPNGHDVEMATEPHAFSGSAPDVAIFDLTVQHYATPAQQGAIDASQASRWTIQGVSASDNHGSGIVLGPNATARDCSTLRNGQQGLGGTGPDVTVDNCEIAFNNTQGYDPAWSAGGTKFALTENLLVENSFVHDNHGPGLWTDVDNKDTTYSNNLVEDNDGDGIFEEISFGARVTGNTIIGNGRAGSTWIFGAGIQVASSSSVQIDGNYLAGNHNSIIGSQQDRGTGRYGDRLLQHLWVHGNTVLSGGQVAVAVDNNRTDVFSSLGIAFDGNTYQGNQAFGWNNMGNLDREAWQSYGQDVHGAWLP